MVTPETHLYWLEELIHFPYLQYQHIVGVNHISSTEITFANLNIIKHQKSEYFVKKINSPSKKEKAQLLEKIYL